MVKTNFLLCITYYDKKNIYECQKIEKFDKKNLFFKKSNFYLNR